MELLPVLSLALPREARLRVGWKETRAGEPERKWAAIPECSIMTAVLLVIISCALPERNVAWSYTMVLSWDAQYTGAILWCFYICITIGSKWLKFAI